MAKSNDKDGATIGSVRDVEKASLAQQMGGGEESVAVDATASTEDLPLSKARCVALVAVLTIASIMSVSGEFLP